MPGATEVWLISCLRFSHALAFWKVKALVAFQNYMGHGLLFRMRQREMCPFAAKPRGKLGGLPAEFQNGTLAGHAHDLNILPAHTVVQTGTDGLHSGFFGSKPGSQTLRRIGFPKAISDLSRG